MESSIPYKRFVPASKYEPKIRCLTSSPRSLASIISAAKLFLIVLLTIFFFKEYLITGFYNYPYSFIFLLIATNGLVILGHQTDQSWAFIPYLVFYVAYNAFVVFLLGVAGVIVVSVAFYNHGYESSYSYVIIFTIMSFVTLLLYTIVEIWCYVIVFKAWHEVKQQENEKKFPPLEELFV